MTPRMDAGREHAKGEVWEALKQVARAKEGALAWEEELRKLERQEKAERSIDPDYFNSDEFKAKKREAIGNIHGWAKHARETISSLDKASMSDEEIKYAYKALDELDNIAGQYEQEMRDVA